MKREIITPRPDWMERADEVGFTYHSGGVTPEGENDGAYWYEEACYAFTAEEVDIIEAASAELHARCLDAVDFVISEPGLIKSVFGIPDFAVDVIVNSWKQQHPYVMGRFDLAFNPKTQQVKMLEYNADTPTLVIETAVVQWFWLQSKFPDADQFNSLHEKLIERYREIGKLLPKNEAITFTSLPKDPDPLQPEASWSPEEYNHVQYFMDLAQQAGLQTSWCPIHELGWDSSRECFVDQMNNQIRFLSKLYPWEWLLEENGGIHLCRPKVMAEMGVLEPAWKMLLSNKAILAVLHRLFPHHNNILPCWFDESEAGGTYIAKPILSREGSNMKLVRPGEVDVITDGAYGGFPMIYQRAVELPKFDGQHVVIGSWMVGEEPAGMIIRESESPIVVSTSRIVPHYFR